MSKQRGERTYKKKVIVNRTCERCGVKQDVDVMHKSKQWHGYLCNDRERCTKKLIEDEKIDVVEEMDRMEAEEELHGTSYERQLEENQTK